MSNLLSRLVEYLERQPRTPPLISVLSSVLSALPLLLVSSAGVMLFPHVFVGESAQVGFIAFSTVISWFLFSSAATRWVCGRFLGGGQLFPSYAIWMVWWLSLPSIRVTTKVQARMEHLLQSSDREEVLEGIALAKSSGRWHSWTQRALPVMWTTPDGARSAVMWEELLRAGAYASRYNEKFIPLTFLAVRRGFYAPALLDAILSAGASLDDMDPAGNTLLDYMLMEQATFNARDFDALVALGARPTKRTVDVLRGFEDSDSAQQVAHDLEATWNRQKLAQVVQSVRPEGLLPPAPLNAPRAL